MAALGKKVFFIVLWACLVLFAKAQRIYQSHSVLASGNWYKIAVTTGGVYKMDVSFLASIGFSGPIASSQLRVFGTDGGMLPEANHQPRIDDLKEVALAVMDGGDGIINGSDYVLFYAPGPNHWSKDSVHQRFSHHKNWYSSKAYYFISIGGVGKRVPTHTGSTSATIWVNSFDDRYFHELDSVNFLSSGKEWFGEEMSNLPGHQLFRDFPVPSSDLILNEPITLVSNVAARSANVPSRFNILINDQLVQQLNVASVGSSFNTLFAQQTQQESQFQINQPFFTMRYNYTPGSFNSQGWLNWFEVFFRRQIKLIADQQLLFRDWKSVGHAAVTFKVASATPAAQVWDVTDPFNAIQQAVVFNGADISFSNEALSLHEYVAFTTSFLTPEAIGKISNQDLHHTSPTDLLIITHPLFLNQAQRLAAFHQQHDGLPTMVVTTNQIFNEFSGGIPDPTALRDFVKMYYDTYRTNWTASGKYLLLFGRGSFDYQDRVTNNTNFVPAYESVSSLDPLSTYTSDDFFGFLDDNEDINASYLVNTLDIGIGRVPLKNAEEAKNFVDKVTAYHTAASFGPWRNNADFIADDEDQNLHLQDAETMTNTAATLDPNLNINKIYLDAFKKEAGTAGGSYPQANAVVNNDIYKGTLIWNYSGHGGASRLAEEDILDQQIVNNFNNANRLPLFITATCDFAPFDLPGVNSLGENLLLRPSTGAIALMTTTRVVFAFSNRILNNNYLQTALQPDALGRYKTLGEAVQSAKNFTYQNGGDVVNNRKFTLLGDPAMTIGFPKWNAVPLLVNGQPVASQTDTLKATQMATITGEITDHQQVRVGNFNGVVYLTLFDKPTIVTTLANAPTSLAASFLSQTNVLFRGKVSVTKGQFAFRFRMPKDINFQYGFGKLSLYAKDSVNDANGYSNKVVIGGLAPGTNTDTEGPQMKAYLNDEKFVNNGLVNSTPLLILKLVDSSGINTGNAGIGHDMVVTIDGDSHNYFVLNNFFETDLNSYQKGTVHFQLPSFSAGHHSLQIKAWDAVNNSNEINLEFTVANDGELVLDHVLNYPNPFTTKTFFWFEHNKPGTELKVEVDIYTVAGRLIKTIRRTINTEGNRSSETDWGGTDNYGDKIGNGVYLYRLSVQTADGKKAGKLQRLVLFH